MSSPETIAAFSPFGNSPLWPPVDDMGKPKPLLMSFLVVLASIVVKLFYSKGASYFEKDIAYKKKSARLAQMTAMLANQQSHFKLCKDRALELKEKDAQRLQIFEAADDLRVKSELRLTVNLEDTFEKKPPEPRLTSPSGAPPALCLDKSISRQFYGKEVEMLLKGRKLTGVYRAGELVSLSTVADIDALFAELSDSEFPLMFVLKSSPPETSRIFDLVVDDVFNVPVTKQGIDEQNPQFLSTRELLQQSVRQDLKVVAAKTLHARSLDGGEDLTADEVHDVEHFSSGAQLREIIALAKKCSKHFPTMVFKQELESAQNALRKVGASQRSSLVQLVKLLVPSLPFWITGVIIHSALECVVARLCTGQTAIMDLVSSGKITVTEATVLILQWISGWLVLAIFGWFTAGLFHGRAARMFGTRVKSEAMKAILQQDFEYFDKNPAGQLQERLNHDAEKLNRNLLHVPKELITESTAILANAYLVYRMAPWDIFATAMLPLPLIAIGQYYMLQFSRRYHRVTRRLGEEAAASTAQVLSEIKTVREFAMEIEEASRYSSTALLQAGIDETCQARAGFCGWGMRILHLIGEAFTLFLGVTRVSNGEMSAGDLIAIMMMVSCMIGGKLRGVFERVNDLALVVEPAGRICDLLNSAPKIEGWTEELRVTIENPIQLAQVLPTISDDGHTVRVLPVSTHDGKDVPDNRRLIGAMTATGVVDTKSGKKFLQKCMEDAAAFPLQIRFSAMLAPAKLGGQFDFDNVEFRYPSDIRKLVLAGVSFTAEQGKQTALVGHAGCGKTTIFKLIQRLYDPTAGRILLDGHPLIHYDVHFLRGKIAIVAQENVLFATSILENVRYGVTPEPCEHDVREALEQASALQFVDAFPDQLHTRVGSRGLALSGGQRQRVAIARAMVRKPNILILDEATSALDPVNEKIVQAALDKLVKTTGACTLTIAHRLTTVKDCDKILVFSDGKLVEQGTHEDLLDIPIEREEPRGSDKEGRLVSGIYRTQWTKMMGVDPSKEKDEQNENTLNIAKELERARTDNESLQEQLRLAQQQLQEATIQMPLRLTENDRMKFNHRNCYLPSLLKAKFNQSSKLSAIESIPFDLDALSTVPPPPLLDRYTTTSW